MRYLSGNELTRDVQQQCLAQFIYRHTPDHKSAARPESWPHGFTHASDTDWLAHSKFAVTRAGKLDARVSSCMSNPTWPFNPEFRTPKRALA